MQRVIVNGANGYVASHFINELLVNGYKVVALVRETSNTTSEQRMKKTLTDINTQVDYKNLEVYNYSLLKKNFSLNSQQLAEIFRDDADFFHFAASLKFKSRDKDEIFKTNVDGTENSLKVFKNNATPSSRFFYISTAYSCGKTSETFKEDFYSNEGIEHFRNYYEQSKRYAENQVKKYIESKKLNAHIIRLSQVVGNNKSGVTKTNYGIFDFIQKIQKFSARYPNEKIRVKINPDATQNLIPIDNIVDYLMELLNKKEIPVIFNFVGRNPVSNNEIARIVNKTLPVEVVQEKELEKKDLNKLERMIASGMSFTGVYTNTDLQFDTENLEKTISLNGNEITRESLHRMIKYFLEQNLKKAEEKVSP